MPSVQPRRIRDTRGLDSRIPPPEDEHAMPPYIPPTRQPMDMYPQHGGLAGPSQPDTSIPGVTGAFDALNYIVESGRTAVGSMLPENLPLFGQKAPTDRTGADEFLPAAARTVLSAVLGADSRVQTIRIALAVTGKEGQQVATALDPIDQQIHTRAQELLARGAKEDDAYKVASLEHVYNDLGAIGAIATGLLLGVPATVAAVETAGLRQFFPASYEQMRQRAERTLPPGSFGGAAVELAIPELGVATGALKALGIARLRLAAGLKAARLTDDPAARATVALEHQADVAAIERTFDAEVSKVEGGINGRTGGKPSFGVPEEGAGPQGAQKVAEEKLAFEAQARPEDAVAKAEITAERVRADAEVARTSGQAVTVMAEEDERAFTDGIRAAVEALPSGERATTNVGEAIARAQNITRSRMRSAIRGAVSRGERFRMQTVTVGMDAEGQAIRQRQMVGSFDQALMDMQSALQKAGRSEAEITEAVSPFLRARHVAAETLSAIEAHNLALKADVALAKTERQAALKAVREARKEQAKAETAAAQAQKGEEQAGQKVEQAQVQQQRKVDVLEQRIADQKERLARERQIQYRVGGDKEPVVTSKRDLEGYPNSEDVRYLEEQGVTNTASFGPRTVGAMAEWVRADPERATLGATHVTWSDITARISDYTGESLDRVRSRMNALVRDNRMTRSFYVLNQVFGDKLRSWQALGKEVKAGRAKPEQWEEATRDLLLFQSDLRSGIGEVARTLAQQRLLKKPDAVQMLNLRKVVKARYADVESIAKRIDALEGKIAESGEGVAEARSALESAVAESERAFAALEDAKAAVNTAAERNLRAALDYAVKRSAKPEFMIALALYDGEDLLNLSKKLRELDPAGVGPLAQTLLLAGRYGRAPAQVGNFYGNLLNMLYQRTVVSAVSEFVAKVPGVGTEALSGISRIFAPEGEVGSSLIGMGRSVPDAWRFFRDTVWEGGSEEIAILHGIANPETLIGQGLDKPADYFRIGNIPKIKNGRLTRGTVEFDTSGPGWILGVGTLRVLVGVDGFFKIMINEGEVVGRSMREGKGAQSFAKADRIIQDAAQEQGLVQTYNRPYGEGFFDKFLKGMGGTVGGFAPIRALVPAIRYGARSVELGLQNAGYGMVSGTLRARGVKSVPESKRVSEARASAREQAMGALGAVEFAMGSMLVAMDIVTGPEPTTETERDRWERLRKKPMSLRLGDIYIPLGWFGAPAAGIALAAATVGAAHDQTDAELGDRVVRAARGLGQYAIDQPGIYVTRQLFDAVYSYAQYGVSGPLERLLANAFKPGAAAQSGAESFTAVFDKYQRDPEGLLQLLMSKAPGLSMSLPPKIDPVTGQPRERSVSGPAALFQTEFQSAGVAKTLTDSVERAVVEVGAGVSSMEKTISSGSLSVKLTQDEYTRLAARAGALGHDVASILITSPDYQTADVRARQSIIQTAYDKARQAARKELAVTLLTGAITPEDAQRALVVSRAVLEEDQYTSAVRLLWSKGMLTEQVTKALDDSRPSFRSPTVGQMVRR